MPAVAMSHAMPGGGFLIFRVRFTAATFAYGRRSTIAIQPITPPPNFEPLRRQRGLCDIPQVGQKNVQAFVVSIFVGFIVIAIAVRSRQQTSGSHPSTPIVDPVIVGVVDPKAAARMQIYQPPAHVQTHAMPPPIVVAIATAVDGSRHRTAGAQQLHRGG